jgi:hypothetical protein
MKSEVGVYLQEEENKLKVEDASMLDFGFHIIIWIFDERIIRHAVNG